MPDLENQIRAYYQATSEPTDVDAIVVDPGTVLVGPFPEVAQRRGIVQTDARPTNEDRPKWWQGPRVAVATFAVVVLAGVAALVAIRDNGPAEHDAATASTPSSIDIALTFDSDACSYDGPAQFISGTNVTSTFTNNSDALAHVTLWTLAEGTTAADIEAGKQLSDPDSLSLLTVSAEPGATSTRTLVINRIGLGAWVCWVTNRDATDATPVANHSHLFDVVES